MKKFLLGFLLLLGVSSQFLDAQTSRKINFGNSTLETLGGIPTQSNSFSVCSTLLVYWFTENLKGGEELSIQGSFPSTAKICLALDDATHYIYVPIVHQEANFVKGILPAALPMGVYQIWVESDTSRSATKYVNKAMADGLNSQIVYSKCPLTIVGKNLLKPGRSPKIRFVSRNNGVVLDASFNRTGSHANRLNIIAPENLVPGESYNVFVSNGYGGTNAEVLMTDTLTTEAPVVDNFQLQLGWSAKFSQATFTNKQDIKTYGSFSPKAAGDGTTNDFTAINNAITTLNAAGGGTVYMPAGIYKAEVGSTQFYGISAKSNVVVQGDGEGKTIIRFGTNAAITKFIQGASNSGFMNMTFQNMDTNTGNFGMMLASTVNYMFFKDCTFIMEHADFMQFTAASSNIALINCKFFQKAHVGSLHGPLYLSGNSFITIRGCQIQAATQNLWVDGATNLFIENTRIIRDVSYTPPSKPVYHLFVIDWVKNALLDNITYGVANGPIPKDPDGTPISNDGESLICESGSTNPDADYGTISSATSTTLVDASKAWGSTYTRSPYVSIVKGKGSGQIRKLTTSRTPTTLTVTTPWDITPDNTSNYVIFNMGLENVRIVNNNFSYNERGITLYACNLKNVDLVDCYLLNSGGIDITPYQIEESGKRANVVYNVEIDGCTVDSRSDPGNGGEIGAKITQFIIPTSIGTLVTNLRIIRCTVIASTPNKVEIVDANWPSGFNAFLLFQQSGPGYTADGTRSLLGTIIQDCKGVDLAGAINLNSATYFTSVRNFELIGSTPLINDATIPGTGHASMHTVTH